MERGAKKAPPKDPGGHKWKKLPKGWTDESRKKFWDSLTSRAPKHKVTQCIKRMEGKVDDPGAFCASLADRVIPGWRQEAAKERRKKKAHELLKEAASLTQPLRTRRDYGTAGPRDPMEPMDGDDEKKGYYEEEEEKPHSQMPGSDNISMLEDADSKTAQHSTPMGPGPDAPPKSRKDKRRQKLHEEQGVKGKSPEYSQLPGTDSLAMEEDRRVASAQWITRDEMERLCPSCAVRMKKAGFTRVHVKVMRKLLTQGG